MAREWSAQQQAFFAWFAKDQNFFNDYTTLDIDVDGNLVGRARAGTGKTTVLIEGVKRAPEKSIIICAFSKVIQLELESRFTVVGANGQKTRTHPHIKCQTIHSIGLSCVRRFRNGINVDFGSTRADLITSSVCGTKVPSEIMKLVTKLHTKGRELAPFAKNIGDLTNLAIEFECEPDEQWANSGFSLDVVEGLALQCMEAAAQVKDGATIDGTDMLYLPVRNGWISPMYDLGVIDEAQDLTTTKLIIARGVVKKGGRIVVVGDDRQAIFGFLGVKSDSIDQLKRELNAGELGLNTTYRCGKNIVNLAQEYVADIYSHESNGDGEIRTSNFTDMYREAGPSDYILSRVNAPLVGIAIKLLRAGKRTRIAGADIGKGLMGLVRKFRARSVPDFLNKVAAWETREHTRLRNMMEGATEGRKKTIETKIADVSDKATMLVELADGAKGISEIEANINTLFKDDGVGVAGMITCSSIHKAKGLEAPRVFILEDTLRYHSIEEQNLVYVAITRAKTVLTWVGDNYPERN